MQSSRLALAAGVAFVTFIAGGPALANIGCPSDLGGIPLILGRPG